MTINAAHFFCFLVIFLEHFFWSCYCVMTPRSTQKKAASYYYVLCVGWRILVLRLYDWWTREVRSVECPGYSWIARL
jgi:hypothetical protein